MLIVTTITTTAIIITTNNIIFLLNLLLPPHPPNHLHTSIIPLHILSHLHHYIPSLIITYHSHSITIIKYFYQQLWVSFQFLKTTAINLEKLILESSFLIILHLHSIISITL